MKNSTKSLLIQASLICGSVVAPLEEKARPLEKNKASGASEGLEPLSTGSTTGSTGAATCYAPEDFFFLVILCFEKRPHINEAWLMLLPS